MQYVCENFKNKVGIQIVVTNSTTSFKLCYCLQNGIQLY